jgi:uncharacterized membrane protein
MPGIIKQPPVIDLDQFHGPGFDVRQKVEHALSDAARFPSWDIRQTLAQALSDADRFRS